MLTGYFIRTCTVQKKKITIIERNLGIENKRKTRKRSINTVVTYGVRVLQKPAKLNNKNLSNKIEHMFKNKVMIFQQYIRFTTSQEIDIDFFDLQF